MPNTTTQELINFQSQIGKAKSKSNLLVAYLIAFILIFIGGFSIYRFIQITFFCPLAKDDITKYNQLKCDDKTQKYKYLKFGLLIPIAIFVLFIAKYNDNLVQSNTAYAALQGTNTELGAIGSIGRLIV